MHKPSHISNISNQPLLKKLLPPILFCLMGIIGTQCTCRKDKNSPPQQQPEQQQLEQKQLEQKQKQQEQTNDPTPSDISQMSATAAREGYSELAETLRKLSNGEPIHDINLPIAGTDGITVIHQAAALGDPNIIKFLTKHGANINATEGEGEVGTALHMAVNSEDPERTKLLIKQGADINATNKYKETPLHMAIHNGNPQIVEQLLKEKHLNINAKDNEGRTPLQTAFENGNHKIIKLLIEHGADLNTKDNQNMTLLHSAVSSESKESVELLLDKCQEKGIDVGVLINQGTSKDRTPLHVANDPKIIQLLIDRGAKLENKNKLGQTPLYEAIKLDKPDKVLLLITKYWAQVEAEVYDKCSDNARIIKRYLSEKVNFKYLN